MSRRADYARLLYLEVSQDEWAAFERIMDGGCFSSPPNCLRSALWSMAEEMGLGLPLGVFDQRHYEGWTGGVRQAPPKCTRPDCHVGIRGDRDHRPRCRCSNLKRNRVPMLNEELKAPPIKRRPGKRHPWREYQQPLKEETNEPNHDGDDDPNRHHQASAETKATE